MKSIIMIFLFMVLLTSPPLDALPQYGPRCQCSNKKKDTDTGNILGDCLNKDATGKFMCYIPKQNTACCEAKSHRLTDYCVNYSLCDKNNDDYHKNDQSVVNPYGDY